MRGHLSKIEALGAYEICCQILEEYVLQADAEGIKVDRDDCHQVGGEKKPLRILSMVDLMVARPF